MWEKDHALTLGIYQASKLFPKEELYGLTSQKRRASALIGANIAEGCRRKGDGEFGKFLHIAIESASELEYHLMLAHDLEILGDLEYQRLSTEVIDVKQMLTFLVHRLKADS